MKVNSEILLELSGRDSSLPAGVAELYNVECEHRAGRSHRMERACQQVQPIQRKVELRESKKEKLKDNHSGGII